MCRIRAAAKRARRWAEKHYESYGTFKDMCGMCGIAAVVVFKELEKEGFVPKLALAEGHAFTICEDKIVDVTATQFGKGKTVVRPRATNKEDFWEPYATFNNVDDYLQRQRDEGWFDSDMIDSQLCGIQYLAENK